MVRKNVMTPPYVTIIGLYTNVPEGGQLDNDQIAWFHAELQAAPKEKALIVAMHHPIYSFDTFHSGSAYMSTILNEAISETERVPDMVLSGHVHNYQRFTRQFTDTGGQQRDIPYIVAGAGGYFHLHYEQSINSQPIDPGHTIQDGNSDMKLETFCDNRHGFLRLEVSTDEITGTYLTVPRPQESWGDKATSFDTFTLHLKTHRL
jgi:acid phosphatase type 7